MNLITLGVLARAIANRLGYTHFHAKKTAEFLLDLFGYDDRIIDNVLDPQDRQLFYLLQSAGIITNGREESILYDGREWRTHYWEFEKENIIDFATHRQRILDQHDLFEHHESDSFSDSIYSTLTDDVWNTRKLFHNKPSFLP